MSSFRDYLENQLKDAAFKEEWDAIDEVSKAEFLAITGKEPDVVEEALEETKEKEEE